MNERNRKAVRVRSLVILPYIWFIILHAQTVINSRVPIGATEDLNGKPRHPHEQAMPWSGSLNATRTIVRRPGTVPHTVGRLSYRVRRLGLMRKTLRVCASALEPLSERVLPSPRLILNARKLSIRDGTAFLRELVSTTAAPTHRSGKDESDPGVLRQAARAVDGLHERCGNRRRADVDIVQFAATAVLACRRRRTLHRRKRRHWSWH